LGDVFLYPGEKKQVALTVPPEAMYTYHEDGSRSIEPGSYTLWVGGGQPDKKTETLLGRKVLSTEFRI
jgi:beta-glucosidase